MTDAIRSIRGMHDILPAELALWRHLESTVQQILARYGFEEIRLPILEKTELFTRAIGQATDVVEKEMYSFDDRNGDSLSLRPEGTAGVVRAALQNGLLYAAPLKVWYAGPMFRYERPQKGRTRQFHQMGAEVFGAVGPDVDAELLAMGERIWSELGLKNIQLQINSLGNSDERVAYRKALVSYMSQHQSLLGPEARQRLERNPLRILDSKDPDIQSVLEDAPVLQEFLGFESASYFQGLCAFLDRMGIDYQLNPRLVRGLDYYCHTVFEWVTDQLGAQGTICAGGRYDGLVEIQGGKPSPATGFAMGMERLVSLLCEQSADAPGARIHVYLVMAGSDAKLEGLALAEELRSSVPDLKISSNAGDGSFKSQFKRADRSGASLALVLGEDELSSGSVSIKFLRDQEPQQNVPVGQAADWLRQWLTRGD